MKLNIYRNKNVRVVAMNGKVYTGKVELYTQPNDNDGEEAIALSCGVWFDESDIKSIDFV